MGRLPDDVAEEARQVMRNIEAVLAASGLSCDDVVKTTNFLTGFDHYAAMNEAYAEFFRRPFPARSTVKVAGLVGGARIEIEAVAVRRSGR